MSHREDRKRDGWNLEVWNLEDDAFERQLLGAAADDAPPAAASERAFRALAADASALAAVTALAPIGAPASAVSPPAVLRPAVLRPAVSPPAVSPPAARTFFSRRSTLTALLLGGVAGGSLVALWLQMAADSAPLVPPLPPRPMPALAAPELEPERGAPPAVAPAEGESQLSPRAPRRPGNAATALDRASRLAREVAVLDAARAALAVGGTQSTLRQLARYHAEFPDGELAADAEAVAIEALAAEGDHAALAAAAQRFLARHPRDPHAARVRELAFIEQPRITQPVPAP